MPRDTPRSSYDTTFERHDLPPVPALPMPGPDHYDPRWTEICGHIRGVKLLFDSRVLKLEFEHRTAESSTFRLGNIISLQTVKSGAYIQGKVMIVYSKSSTGDPLCVPICYHPPTKMRPPNHLPIYWDNSGKQSYPFSFVIGEATPRRDKGLSIDLEHSYTIHQCIEYGWAGTLDRESLMSLIDKMDTIGRTRAMMDLAAVRDGPWPEP